MTDGTKPLAELSHIREDVRINVECPPFNFGEDANMRGHSRGTWRERHQFPGDLYLEADGSYKFSIKTATELSTPELNLQITQMTTECTEVHETATVQTTDIDSLTATVRKLMETVNHQQSRIDILSERVQWQKTVIDELHEVTGRQRKQLDHLEMMWMRKGRFRIDDLSVTVRTMNISIRDWLAEDNVIQSPVPTRNGIDILNWKENRLPPDELQNWKLGENAPEDLLDWNGPGSSRWEPDPSAPTVESAPTIGSTSTVDDPAHPDGWRARRVDSDETFPYEDGNPLDVPNEDPDEVQTWLLKREAGTTVVQPADFGKGPPPPDSGAPPSGQMRLDGHIFGNLFICDFDMRTLADRMTAVEGALVTAGLMSS